mgnify:CR=1 FL=1
MIESLQSTYFAKNENEQQVVYDADDIKFFATLAKANILQQQRKSQMVQTDLQLKMRKREV